MLNLMFVHLLGLLTPGPDFFYVTRMAASNSRRNTTLGILGISFGIMVWAAAAMLGLAIIFKTMPALQGVVMLLGGSYLIYLGLQMLKSQGQVQFTPLSEAELNQRTSVKKEIIKGLLVNLSNAKAIIYFASVMSFVLVDITTTAQMLLAFWIIVLETFLYFYVLSLFFSRPLAKKLYSQYSLWIDRFAGIVFILFGGLLAYNGILTILS